MSACAYYSWVLRESAWLRCASPGFCAPLILFWCTPAPVDASLLSALPLQTHVRRSSGCMLHLAALRFALFLPVFSPLLTSPLVCLCLAEGMSVLVPVRMRVCHISGCLLRLAAGRAFAWSYVLSYLCLHAFAPAQALFLSKCLCSANIAYSAPRPASARHLRFLLHVFLLTKAPQFWYMCTVRLAACFSWPQCASHGCVRLFPFYICPSSNEGVTVSCARWNVCEPAQVAKASLGCCAPRLAAARRF